ncbi:hypothetical protein LEP1GSC036_2683 [Leptospira weilii str. 2006001853]|uniref:Uncharacterized protein n=2 Tax=Leptospira weilii TaxID=28184 RepID=A0A828Z3L9_9LEPT|nr:hypothetical protein LEP1GSC036_2683 [Leptospira weilii str. 2006001853]EMJ62765.1 hypothetical protein LEP1GSC051_1846 [Leptospira sp. P2653]EMN45089.1 hypothetical protein LEP1GSC086_2736 [Leptospira weilii str. LNT 1234]EMN91928.1 hypothetical protein LEP1GSC108_0585 [Leptospira weilii str. UI 13098]
MFFRQLPRKLFHIKKHKLGNYFSKPYNKIANTTSFQSPFLLHSQNIQKMPGAPQYSLKKYNSKPYTKFLSMKISRMGLFEQTI